MDWILIGGRFLFRKSIDILFPIFIWFLHTFHFWIGRLGGEVTTVLFMARRKGTNKAQTLLKLLITIFLANNLFCVIMVELSGDKPKT